MKPAIPLMLTSVALLAAATGCSSGGECSNATDCGTGQACEAGKCVPVVPETCSPACVGATPVCDAATNTCRVCTAEAGCAAGERCDVSEPGGRCVRCLEDAHCSGPTPVCDLTTHTCAICTAGRGCASGQACDTSVKGGVCTGCGDDSHCSGETPYCNAATHWCVVCTAERGCPAGKKCDTSAIAGACVECTASTDCPNAKPYCDTAAHACVTCTATEGCSGATPLCDTRVAGGACVECLADAQCTDSSKPYCGPGGRCESTSPAHVSAQIAAVRGSADGTGLSLPIAGAIVTVVRPMLGDDPAGFFVQAEKQGPALFVAVDPATLVPVPVPGARVSFTVEALTTVTYMRHVTAIADFARLDAGVAVSPLVQDLSAAADVLTNLDGYESELVSLTGTLGAFTDSGTAHVAAQLTTAGVDAVGLRLRMTETLRAQTDLTEGCAVTLAAGPMWRHRSSAQPMAFNASDLTAVTCPAPKVLTATAASLTQVVVTFDRKLDPASVRADGSQFTFTAGLTATAASVAGDQVTVTTTAQVPKTSYTVTAASTVLDLHGRGVDPSHASATFVGDWGQATLLITEVNPNIPDSKDLIEFLVLKTGTTKQLAITEEGSGTRVLATLPDVVVVAGDVIVLHLNPSGDSPSAAERTSKTESTAAGAFATAWDFVGGSAGVTFSHRVLMVKTPAGDVQDAVAFMKSDLAGTPPSGYLTALKAAQDAGQWSPANCGGVDCAYGSTPSALDVSVDWMGVGNTRASSLSRVSGPDTNAKADWSVKATGASFGVANP